MVFNPTWTTGSLDLKARVELARMDARLGRLTAEQAIEFAAEVAEETRAWVADAREQAEEEAKAEYGHIRDELNSVYDDRREAERLNDRRREAAESLIAEMDAYEAKARHAGAVRHADAVLGWADKLRAAFGLKGARA